MYVGSFWIMGISMVAHALFLMAIVITVATFETAKNRPSFFLRMEHKTNGYHTPSRSRGYMWVNGQKVKLDPNDPGGEHE